MTERWSLSDMQTYGAEDEADMDAIMAAMNKFERETDEPAPDSKN